MIIYLKNSKQKHKRKLPSISLEKTERLTCFHSNNDNVWWCDVPWTPTSINQSIHFLQMLHWSCRHSRQHVFLVLWTNPAWTAKNIKSDLGALCSIYNETSPQGFSPLFAASSGNAETKALLDLSRAQKVTTRWNPQGGAKTSLINGRCQGERELSVPLVMSQKDNRISLAVEEVRGERRVRSKILSIRENTSQKYIVKIN